MHADLQRLLAPDLLPDSTTPLDELRQLRMEASSAEGDVSFVRRVAQGRLDIIGHETRRRSGAHDRQPEATGLLFDLPDVLSAGSTAPSPSKRPVAIHQPGAIAQALVAELDQVAPPSELTSLPRLDHHRLAVLWDGLRDFEIELSATRRRLHERIDMIQNEVARRYREGEASVDSLLS